MGVFWSGAWSGGNNVFTPGGSFPLSFLEKRDEVANLVDSSLMEKKQKKQSARCYREQTLDRASQEIAVFFSLSLPTPQTDRHLVVRKSV